MLSSNLGMLQRHSPTTANQHTSKAATCIVSLCAFSEKHTWCSCRAYVQCQGLVPRLSDLLRLSPFPTCCMKAVMSASGSRGPFVCTPAEVGHLLDPDRAFMPTAPKLLPRRPLRGSRFSFSLFVAVIWFLLVIAARVAIDVLCVLANQMRAPREGTYTSMALTKSVILLLSQKVLMSLSTSTSQD